MANRQKFAFVKRGAAAMLAVTLVSSMAPMTAVAADGSAQSGAAIEASNGVMTSEGYYVEVGKAYSLPISLKNSNGSGADSMAAQFLEKSMTATYDGSAWTLSIRTTDNEMSSMIEWISINGIQQSGEGDGIRTFTFSGIEKLASVTSVAFKVGAPMNMEMSAIAALDTSSLPTEDPNPAPSVDKSALEAAVEEAKALIAAGEKDEAAIAALQEAIDTAEKALANENIPQMGVDAVLGQLNEAIEAYKASGSGSGSEDPQTQTLDVNYFVKDSGNSFSGMLPAQVQAVEAAEGGYDLSIPVAASTINMVGGTFWMKDAADADAAMEEGEDGSRTYTIHVDSVAGAIEFSFGYTVSVGGGQMSQTHNMIARFFDCSAINDALAAAKAIEDDGSEAYAAFAQAYDAAKEVVKNPAATAAQLDQAATDLRAAIEDFNNNVEAVDPNPEPTPDPDDSIVNADGFEMVIGQDYVLPVTFINTATGAESMGGQFMEKEVTVVYNEGETYSVTVSPNEMGKKYLTSLAAEGYTVNANEDGSYTIIGVKTILKDIALTVGMPGGSQTMGMRIDTSSLPTGDGEIVKPEPPATNPDNNNNQNNNNNNNQVTEQFQVGHTYQVPIAFLKSGSSEQSMSAQYFGDSALVRPQENGTFTVSFSTNRPDYISSLSYNGGAVSQSGSQYTLSIPAATSDQVLALNMQIAPMNNLSVSADMHLYLSQAVDLGAGKDSLVASSAQDFAKTGDSTPVAGLVGLAGVAAAGIVAAGAIRRRFDAQ